MDVPCGAKNHPVIRKTNGSQLLTQKPHPGLPSRHRWAPVRLRSPRLRRSKSMFTTEPVGHAQASVGRDDGSHGDEPGFLLTAGAFSDELVKDHIAAWNHVQKALY